MSEWTAVGALAVVAVAIPASMMAVSWLLRPSVPEQGKRATYESGEVPTGSSRGGRFDAQYYTVALLFVVFSVEVLFIVPWAVVFEDAVGTLGLAAALAPMVAFVGLLVLGLAWAWRTGAIRWVEPTTDE